MHSPWEGTDWLLPTFYNSGLVLSQNTIRQSSIFDQMHNDEGGFTEIIISQNIQTTIILWKWHWLYDLSDSQWGQRLADTSHFWQSERANNHCLDSSVVMYNADWLLGSNEEAATPPRGQVTFLRLNRKSSTKESGLGSSKMWNFEVVRNQVIKLERLSSVTEWKGAALIESSVWHLWPQELPDLLREPCAWVITSMEWEHHCFMGHA